MLLIVGQFPKERQFAIDNSSGFDEELSHSTTRECCDEQ